MKITYSHESDALYIELTAHPVMQSKRITANLAVDFDEAGEAVGVEVLNASASGIDPLNAQIIHSLTNESVERPNQDEIRQRRAAKIAALKQLREKEQQV